MSQKISVHQDKHKQQQQVRLIPLFDREATPPMPGESPLFRDRVFCPQDRDYYFIALPAPAAELYEEYLPVAARLLDEHWYDSGDVKYDILRAVVTILNHHVPEYAAAAALFPNRAEEPELMPPVIFSLSDGQIINVGRPHYRGGALGSSFDRASALSRSVQTSPHFGPRNAAQTAKNRAYHRIDETCEKLYDTNLESYMLQPVEEVLATLLAASEPSRNDILKKIDPDLRPSLPRGPLRVQDPRL